MSIKKLIICLFCIFIASACTRSDGSYSVLTDRPISLQALTHPNSKIISASAVSRRHVAILVPFSKAPSVTDAIEAVIQQYKGDYLADAEVKLVNVQLMFWYHYKAWEVSGTVMRIRHQ